MTTPSASFSTRDRNGQPVFQGSVIRLITIAQTLLNSLENSERLRVSSMLGEQFEVYEVDQWGKAWIEKYWTEPEGDCSHSLGLEPAEMELASLK